MSRFDVAIVGAGPAGCRAAGLLAQTGARVAVIDASHPREKPCGGGVTGRALALVHDTIELAALDAVAIESATFVDGARVATLPIDPAGEPGRGLVIVARRDFDGALLRSAVAAGACLVESRAIDVARANGGWSIATRAGPIEADWLVGADGPNSLVRRRVSSPFRRQDLSIASGYFVHGASSSAITVVFEHDPPGYLWAFPRRDHVAVGVGAQADESSSAGLLAIAARWIRQHLDGAGVRLERYSWPIPSFGVEALDRERPSGNRWMLAGDAGGLVDPITREGIFFALASGQAAAESLLQPDPARAYAARIREGIHDELRRAARLKSRFFDRRFTALMVDALGQSPRIQRVMADLVAGEQPYRGLKRRLLRTWELRLIWELFTGSAERSEAASAKRARERSERGRVVGPHAH
jgi:geranylgeranyl reductase family protein